MKQITLPVLILIIVVALGAGFGGGYFFRNNQISMMRGNFLGQTQGRNGTSGMVNRQGRGFGGAVVGDIISQDDKSITVKLSDGSTKIVLLGGSTTYSQTSTATNSDLKVGTHVGVFGTANSDGSVTAQNVQINPTSARPQGSPSPTQ